MMMMMIGVPSELQVQREAGTLFTSYFCCLHVRRVFLLLDRVVALACCCYGFCTVPPKAAHACGFLVHGVYPSALSLLSLSQAGLSQVAGPIRGLFHG